MQYPLGFCGVGNYLSLNYFLFNWISLLPIPLSCWERSIICIPVPVRASAFLKVDTLYTAELVSKTPHMFLTDLVINFPNLYIYQLDISVSNVSCWMRSLKNPDSVSLKFLCLFTVWWLIFLKSVSSPIGFECFHFHVTWGLWLIYFLLGIHEPPALQVMHASYVDNLISW